MIHEAASSDAQIAEVLRATRERQRRDVGAGIEMILERVPTAAERDGIWAMASPELYLLLWRSPTGPPSSTRHGWPRRSSASFLPLTTKELCRDPRPRCTSGHFDDAHHPIGVAPGSRRAVAVLRRSPPPATATSAVASHLEWMMGTLHDHHRSEDAGLYPMIRERGPTQPRPGP